MVGLYEQNGMDEWQGYNGKDLILFR